MSSSERRRVVALVGGWYALNALAGLHLYDPSLAGKAAAAAGNAAARHITPITKAMRDKVRAWAVERAMRAQGIHTTEGVAVAAAKAALTGQVMGRAPANAADWKSVPDNSVIGMPGGKNFRGKDIKSLVRDAVAAQKNHIANAPQLEASTAPRYADKARAITGALKKPRRATGKGARKRT
jgi:hypothetical protein